MKEIDQVLRSKELELSQVEIEVQSLRIVAELLGEEADQEEARNARHSLDVAWRRRETHLRRRFRHARRCAIARQTAEATAPSVGS